MIPSLYLAVGGTALAVASGFYVGTRHEHRTHVAREVAAAARIEASRAKLQNAFDTVATKAAQKTQIQTQTFTEIRHVAGPIIYRNVAVCVPAADAGLLDRARDAANGTVAGQPAGGAAVSARVPAQR